jgi:hypothetical protein
MQLHWRVGWVVALLLHSDFLHADSSATVELGELGVFV